jgi:hypothetical protein
MSRYRRIMLAAEKTMCTCKGEGKPRCPQSPLDILCTISGLCYDTDFYWESVCDASSCGRWMDNEKDYRGARNRCRQSFDGAAANGVGVAAAGAAALAAALLLRGAGGGGDEDDDHEEEDEGVVQ